MVGHVGQRCFPHLLQGRALARSLRERGRLSLHAGLVARLENKHSRVVVSTNAAHAGGRICLHRSSAAPSRKALAVDIHVVEAAEAVDATAVDNTVRAAKISIALPIAIECLCGDS